MVPGGQYDGCGAVGADWPESTAQITTERVQSRYPGGTPSGYRRNLTQPGRKHPPKLCGARDGGAKRTRTYSQRVSEGASSPVAILKLQV